MSCHGQIFICWIYFFAYMVWILWNRFHCRRLHVCVCMPLNSWFLKIYDRLYRISCVNCLVIEISLCVCASVCIFFSLLFCLVPIAPVQLDVFWQQLNNHIILLTSFVHIREYHISNLNDLFRGASCLKWMYNVYMFFFFFSLLFSYLKWYYVL